MCCQLRRKGGNGGRAVLESIVIGAVASLGTAFFANRRFFLRSRVRDESAIKQGVRDQESAVGDEPGRGRPGRVHGQVQRVRGEGIAVGASKQRASERQIDCYMPAIEHIERFIAWLVMHPDGRVRPVRDTHDKMFNRYLIWTWGEFVEPLPEKTWQTLMKRHTQVGWKRDPIKDPATGRILRKPSGAPERETYYTVRPPRAEPAMPGKPPVADIVPVRATPTKKQRAAAKATAVPSHVEPLLELEAA